MADLAITPIDPAGAVNDWRQQLSNTAVMESQARQAPVLEEQRKMQLQLSQMLVAREKQQDAADQQFRAAVKEISPDLPITERLGRMATIAMENGKTADAEKLLSQQSIVANRESLAEQREAAKGLKAAQESAVRLKRQEELLPMMSSATGMEMANDMYKSEYGDDLPFVKTMRRMNVPWSKQVWDNIRNGLVKQKSDLDDAVKRATLAHIQGEEQRARDMAAARKDAVLTKTEQIKAQIEARRKAGAGKVGTVGKMEERLTSQELRKLQPNLEGAELELATLELADQAKAIQLKEAGPFSDALNKAIAARPDAFKTKPGGMFSRDKTTFTPKPAASAPDKVPAGMPAGSKPIGKTPEGKAVYQAPNGKKYVED